MAEYTSHLFPGIRGNGSNDPRGRGKRTMAATTIGAVPTTRKQQAVSSANLSSTTANAPATTTEEFATTSETQRLCVDLLINGNTRSFVDFFLLTHKLNEEEKQSKPNQIRSMFQEGSRVFPATISPAITQERLQYVKEHLSESERAERQRDMKGSASALSMIAEQFEKHSDPQSLKVAVHFHERALEIAASVNDAQLEGSAHRALGTLAQKIGDNSNAITHYERFNEFAASTPSATAQQVVANKHLIVVYRAKAEELEQSGDYLAASDYFSKCLACAEKASDKESIGQAHYHLGLCFKQLQKSEESISHLQAYLELCRAAHDEIGEGLACSALAAVHQNSNDSSRSVKYLEENLALAQRTGQLDAEAKASCNLGIICNKSGDFARAAEYFSRYFELAKQLGDARMLDSARIHLGVARGNIKLQQFATSALSCPTPEDVIQLIRSTFL